MANNVVPFDAIESAIVQGDLSKLTVEQRLAYYHRVCESTGLNPLTKPFEYITLNGRLTLYARRDATDQLRKIHGVSITKLETVNQDGIVTVTAYARDKEGKEDSDIGSVDVAGLRGEKLANAVMKASTKAKRRVTLSICGLGFSDETEISDIPSVEKVAKVENPFPKQAAVAQPPPLSVEVIDNVPPQETQKTDKISELSEAPICCDREMMVSNWPNKATGNVEWYCPKCRSFQPMS